MALETGNFIDDLVVSNPAAGDQMSEGDDHIRLLKNVLKNTFPGLTEALFPVSIARGGTGAVTQSAAQTALGVAISADNYAVGSSSSAPNVTFETPGDVSVGYASQTYAYEQIGSTVRLRFNLIFTPTFTTASGAMLLTGLPVAPVSASDAGSIAFIGSTFTWPVSRTMLTVRTALAPAGLRIAAHGSGIATTFIGATHMASGVEHAISGGIVYAI